MAGTPGAAWLADAGYHVWLERDEASLALAFGGMTHGAAILDLEQGPSLSLLRRARDVFPRVVNIGCIGFYPTEAMSAVDALTDLQVFGVELFSPPRTDHELSGPDFLLVDPVFGECSPSFDGHILVTLGGADPRGLSPIAVRALADCGRHVKLIVGPAATFAPDDPLPANVRLYRSPKDMPLLFNGAALCVTATGTTAYESLCAGVPPVLTSWATDHLPTADELKNRGLAANLGLWSEFDERRLARVVAGCLNDAEWWHKASYGGRRLVDGDGAGRVSEVICKLIAAR